MSLDEKRKQYKCGSNYLTLENIAKYSQSGVKSTSESSEFKAVTKINEKLSIFKGDITTLEIDAIVNAANAKLAGGGGGTTTTSLKMTSWFYCFHFLILVDGFIHRAAGHDDLQAECQTLGGCETGHCKITGGYRLPAKCNVANLLIH